MCVFFISQDFLVSRARSHLSLKSSLYISTEPICGTDGFLLTFVSTLLSASISIYYPCVSAGPLQHNGGIIGGWWETVDLKALTGVAVRCCFLGDLYGLRLQRLCSSVKLLLALLLSSHTWAPSTKPPPRAFYLALLPPLFPFTLSVSQHHHIHAEGSAPASCSTITSPNPPPRTCISAVLIAPETQSNGQEMCAGVQLTGSPLFPLFPQYLLHIRPVSQALCGLLCSP